MRLEEKGNNVNLRRLLSKKIEDHIEFLEEIGVAATVKVNDSNPETEEKTVLYVFRYPQGK